MDELLSTVGETGVNALDFAIDKITESKYFAGFPIVSQVLDVLKAGKLISNFFYTKKIGAFLDGLKSDSLDCDIFSDAMKKLNVNATRFEEELLFLIEKAENTEKAKLLGHFTRYLALGKISYDDFCLFANAVNNIQLSFLKELSKNYKNKEYLSKSVLSGILQAHGFVIKFNEVQPSILDTEEHHSTSAIEEKSFKLAIEEQYSEKLDDFGKYLESFFAVL